MVMEDEKSTPKRVILGPEVCFTNQRTMYWKLHVNNRRQLVKKEHSSPGRILSLSNATTGVGVFDPTEKWAHTCVRYPSALEVRSYLAKSGAKQHE